MKLFEDEFGVDESPQDDTQITTTLLYFSDTELKEFKAGCKQAMRKMFGHQVMEKGNMSDLLLQLIKKYNEDDNTETTSQRHSSGSPEGDLFGGIGI
jgi:hypothetical protein